MCEVSLASSRSRRACVHSLGVFYLVFVIYSRRERDRERERRERERERERGRERERERETEKEREERKRERERERERERGEREKEREREERERERSWWSFYRSCGNVALNHFKYLCIICVEKLYFDKTINKPKRVGVFEKTFRLEPQKPPPPLSPWVGISSALSDTITYIHKKRVKI